MPQQVIRCGNATPIEHRLCHSYLFDFSHLIKQQTNMYGSDRQRVAVEASCAGASKRACKVMIIKKQCNIKLKLDQCHNKSFVTVVAAMPLPLSAATSANLFL